METKIDETRRSNIVDRTSFKINLYSFVKIERFYDSMEIV